MDSCTSCNDFGTDLYYCSGCPDYKVPDNQTRSILCDTCVGAHIKKGHIVKTLKDQDPVICRTHKKLHTVYCKTCKITFCPNCLNNHRSHSVESCDIEAKSARNFVFKALGELEIAEKPLRAKQETIKKFHEKVEEEKKQLKEIFSKRVDEIKGNVIKHIESEIDEGSNELEDFAALLDKVSQLEEDLRNLLALPQSLLLKESELVQVRVEQINKQIVDTIAQESNAKSRVVELLSRTLNIAAENFENKIGKLLKEKAEADIPSETKDEIVPDNSEFYCGEFRISTKSSNLVLDKLNSSKVEFKKVFSVPFGAKISSVYVITKKEMEPIITIVSKNCVFTIKSDCYGKLKLEQFFMPTYEHFICPYAIDEPYDTIYCCHWDRQEQAIKFSHNKKFEIPCRILPKVKTNIFSDYLVLCVENDVILHVNCNNIRGSDHISYSNITASLIPLKTIDYVSFVDNCETFWSINSQCVVIRNHYDCSYSYSEEPCPKYQKES